MRAFTLNFKKIVSIFTALAVMYITASSYCANSNAINTSQMYNVYNAQTGNYTSCYSLNPLPSSNNSRALYYTDDRVTDWSKSGVVKIAIVDFWGEKDTVTGFVVGDHTIATAAHCVYNNTIDHIYLFNTDDTSGITSSNTIEAVEYHVPYSYIYAGGTGTNDYDYALIKVNENLNAYACFNLGVPLDSAVDNELAVSCTGFPMEVNDEDTHNLLTGTGNLIQVPLESTDKKIHHTVDTSGGNSGSPLYVTETRNGKNFNTVIGIHVSGRRDYYNSATKITTDLIHFYYANPNI